MGWVFTHDRLPNCLRTDSEPLLNLSDLRKNTRDPPSYCRAYIWQANQTHFPALGVECVPEHPLPGTSERNYESQASSALKHGRSDEWVLPGIELVQFEEVDSQRAPHFHRNEAEVCRTLHREKPMVSLCFKSSAVML